MWTAPKNVSTQRQTNFGRRKPMSEALEREWYLRGHEIERLHGHAHARWADLEDVEGGDSSARKDVSEISFLKDDSK
jgi:hypothetical protein